MNDSKFWIKQLKTMCITIVLIIVSIIGGCGYTKHTIAKMVENGASPMEAACSLEVSSGSSYSNPTCTLFLTR